MVIVSYGVNSRSVPTVAFWKLPDDIWVLSLYRFHLKLSCFNSSGKVTAKKAGTCTITLTDTQKRTYKCTVTVKSSSKSAALKAYYNFLKSYKFDLDSSSRGFDLAYINNDSIKNNIFSRFNFDVTAYLPHFSIFICYI